MVSPGGGSAAVLLTLGWSLSSSSKNSVVPPDSLATPCRSLLQARGPRPRPKHLQRWCSRNIQFMSHLLRKLNYDTTIIKWQLSSLSTFTEWSLMHCLHHTYNTYRHWPSEQIKYQPLATTWTSVSIYLCETIMAQRGSHVSWERGNLESSTGQSCYLGTLRDHNPFG